MNFRHQEAAENNWPQGWNRDIRVAMALDLGGHRIEASGLSRPDALPQSLTASGRLQVFCWHMYSVLPVLDFKLPLLYGVWATKLSPYLEGPLGQGTCDAGVGVYTINGVSQIPYEWVWDEGTAVPWALRCFSSQDPLTISLISGDPPRLGFWEEWSQLQCLSQFCHFLSCPWCSVHPSPFSPCPSSLCPSIRTPSPQIL